MPVALSMARCLLGEGCMEGTKPDRDPWMDKITRALQGFRQASQRLAEMPGRGTLATRNDVEDAHGPPAWKASSGTRSGTA